MPEEFTTPVAAAPEGLPADTGPETPGAPVTPAEPSASPREYLKDGKWLGKYESPEAVAEALIAQQRENARLRQVGKQSPKEVASALLQTQQDTQQVPPITTRAEGVAVAQQAGGDALGMAFENLAKDRGTAYAVKALTEWVTNQVVTQQMQQYIEPLTRQTKETEMQVAFNAVMGEYSVDADQYATTLQSLSGFMKTRPTLQKALKAAESREEMYEVLSSAYASLQRQGNAEVAKTAKAAGAKQEQTRSQMSAAAAAETGRGGDLTRTQQPNLADEWGKAAQEYDKGRRLFKD